MHQLPENSRPCFRFWFAAVSLFLLIFLCSRSYYCLDMGYGLPLAVVAPVRARLSALIGSCKVAERVQVRKEKCLHAAASALIA